MIYYSHYIAYTFGSHDYVCKKKIKNGKSVDLNGFLYYSVYGYNTIIQDIKKEKLKCFSMILYYSLTYGRSATYLALFIATVS